jgi:hypothetical protein
MKQSTFFIAITLALTMPCLAADTSKPTEPRYIAIVTCFNGKLDSGSSCSAMPTQEPQSDSKLQVTRGLTCGWPGKVSELHWEFVGQRDKADVYRIIRRFPSDTPNAVTTTNMVSFSGTRITVFEDKDQVIVMEGPKK